MTKAPWLETRPYILPLKSIIYHFALIGYIKIIGCLWKIKTQYSQAQFYKIQNYWKLTTESCEKSTEGKRLNHKL